MLGQNTWTMDVNDAIEAVKIIKPRIVIPCHYNVPFFWKRKIALADDADFKREVEKLGVECRLLKAGESFTLQ